MYINLEKNLSKSRFTRMCIGEAIIRLLQKKALDEITVSAIASKAGVSRMTFYHYYETKHQALSDYLVQILDLYTQSLDSKSQMNFQKPEHILYALEFFDQYSNYFTTLVKHNLHGLITDCMNEYMEKQFKSAYPESIYQLYYYAGALLNTFLKWEENKKPIPAKELAKLISKMTI